MLLRMPAGHHPIKSLLLFALAAPLSSSAAQSDPRPTVLIGRVINQDTKEPVADAVVELIEQERRTETDALGNFRFTLLAPELGTLRVRAVGFTAVTKSVVLREGRTERIEVAMSPAAVVLPDVTVEERERNAAVATSIMSGFEDRKKMGWGSFIEYDEIKRNEGVSVASLIGRFPGIELRGGLRVASRRRGCLLTIILDNAVIYTGQVPSRGDPDISRYTNLSNLAAIEIYPTQSSLPPEFQAVGGRCGAVVLWTRRGGPPP